MAESALHKELVRRLHRAVSRALGPQAAGIVDRGGGDRDPTWMIGGSHPDVRAIGAGLEVVGEAKPPSDLETLRSKMQVRTFMRYIERVGTAHLVLAVQWGSAPTAWNVLRRSARNWNSVRDRVHVLDGSTDLALPTPQKA